MAAHDRARMRHCLVKAFSSTQRSEIRRLSRKVAEQHQDAPEDVASRRWQEVVNDLAETYGVNPRVIKLLTLKDKQTPSRSPGSDSSALRGRGKR